MASDSHRPSIAARAFGPHRPWLPFAITAVAMSATLTVVWLVRGLQATPPPRPVAVDVAMDVAPEPEEVFAEEIEELEESDAAPAMEEAVSDKPFQGKYWNSAIGVGGGAGGAYGGRFGGRRSLVARGGGGRASHRGGGEVAGLRTGAEVWVIERPAAPADPAAATRSAQAIDLREAPGQGMLLANAQAAEQVAPCPLEHTDVRAEVTGYIGTVDVTQRFRNPFTETIEAVYVFPLPSNAAVNEFLMQVGDRTIHGLIRERGEAERVYQAARRAGHTASLLTQERPNVFQQKVANLAPGHRIDVTIRYFHTLDYVDGWYEWVFPMVVGPRYNPPGFRSGIGAVGYGEPSAAASRQPVNVHYTRAPERSGHDVALRVSVDAGTTIEEFQCRTHAHTAAQPLADRHRLTVTLDAADAIPNTDFVLRWRVASIEPKQALFTQPDGNGGGWFTLVCYPPATIARLDRRPMELIFVVDCSGSMRGTPLDKAKAAIDRALAGLRDTDTFQVIRFSNDASALGAAPLPATIANVARARTYLAGLHGTGGTAMIEGIKAALDFPHDPSRTRVVSFMTDGYIGNEAQILRAMEERLNGARVFSFGVGSSPNRWLLEQMAVLGHGAVAWVGNDEVTGKEAVDGFYDRISRPALYDVELDAGSWRIYDVYPTRMPDLFVGRPVVVTGRYFGQPDVTIRVNGKQAGAPVSWGIASSPLETGIHGGVAAIWARHKLAELSTALLRIPSHDRDSAAALQQTITTTALNHRLLSAYTAFVAVDESAATADGGGVRVPVAVPLPSGMAPPEHR